MKRFLPRIWVFVMAFGLGISISAIWRIYTLPAFTLPAQDFVIAPVEKSEGPYADLIDGPRLLETGQTHSCGAPTGPQVYNYSDGGRITVNCRRFKNHSTAARELMDRLRGDTIEAHSLIQDDYGGPLGEEFLVTAPGIVRIRIQGSLLCEVEASSLYHLTWFEKRR